MNTTWIAMNANGSVRGWHKHVVVFDYWYHTYILNNVSWIDFCYHKITNAETFYFFQWICEHRRQLCPSSPTSINWSIYISSTKEIGITSFINRWTKPSMIRSCSDKNYSSPFFSNERATRIRASQMNNCMWPSSWVVKPTDLFVYGPDRKPKNIVYLTKTHSNK